ncbi:hypothetical protein L7F22_018692 [Adiantum nelumboides]|nr:hypothetical protein [Adiantum nelumboides]
MTRDVVDKDTDSSIPPARQISYIQDGFHGVELTVQSERAFQKQPIYQNSKTRSALGLVRCRSVRRILTGRVVSTKMTRTIIIRREYLHYVPMYNRYERRHSKLPVHVSPAFRVAVGDEVIVGQTRPLSKTIRYNLLRISRSQAEKQEKVFGKF